MHTSNAFFIVELGYKVLQTSELPLLYDCIEKIWDFNKKNVSHILLKSKDRSRIEKLNMYFGKADTLISFSSWVN